jgi:hypothetical protein
MAKKSKKKAGKVAKAGGKKASKKGASKPAKKAGKKKPAGPTPVSTGRGAGPDEIGRAVVESFNSGRPEKELWAKWWSPKAVSVEGHGMAMAWSGMKAIAGKAEWWTSAHTVHGASAEGPYLGASGFSIKFRMDVEEKASGKREVMEEVGVYTVQNGKVVREEFMYGPRQQVQAAAPAGDAAMATV